MGNNSARADIFQSFFNNSTLFWRFRFVIERRVEYRTQDRITRHVMEIGHITVNSVEVVERKLRNHVYDPFAEYHFQFCLFCCVRHLSPPFRLSTRMFS